jgi:hypothetical protein
MAALAVAFLLAAGHPCEADAQRLCHGTEPGGGGIARCLKQHESELSGACKAKRESYREHAAEVRAACQDDAARLCKGVKPGGGGIARCLLEHASELSEPCKKEADEMEGRRQKVQAMAQALREACKDDTVRFCGGVQPGGARLGQCLKQHEGELSARCKDAATQIRMRR